MHHVSSYTWGQVLLLPQMCFELPHVSNLHNPISFGGRRFAQTICNERAVATGLLIAFRFLEIASAVFSHPILVKSVPHLLTYKLILLRWRLLLLLSLLSLGLSIKLMRNSLPMNVLDGAAGEWKAWSNCRICCGNCYNSSNLVSMWGGMIWMANSDPGKQIARLPQLTQSHHPRILQPNRQSHLQRYQPSSESRSTGHVNHDLQRLWHIIV